MTHNTFVLEVTTSVGVCVRYLNLFFDVYIRLGNQKLSHLKKAAEVYG